MADEPGILRRSHAKVNHGHHAPFVQSVLIMRPSFRAVKSGKAYESHLMIDFAFRPWYNFAKQR